MFASPARSRRVCLLHIPSCDGQAWQRLPQQMEMVPCCMRGERSSSPHRLPVPLSFASMFIKCSCILARNWEHQTSQRGQKCFLLQFRCFQGRASPSVRHSTCEVMEAFSWQAAEGRALQAMARAIPGGWLGDGGLLSRYRQMCEHHEEQTKRTHVHSEILE